MEIWPFTATYCCYSYTFKSLFLSLQCFLSKYLRRYGRFSYLLLLQLYLYICIIYFSSMFSSKFLWRYGHFSNLLPLQLYLYIIIPLSLMFSFKSLVEILPFQQPTAVAVILVNHYFSLFNVFFQSTCGDMAISAT